MNAQTAKVLLKVEDLRNRLLSARSKKESFSDIHEEILNLSQLVLHRKSQYGLIDVSYPEELLIRISDVTDDTVEEINATPHIESDLEDLAKKLFDVLDRIKRSYSLRKEIEFDIPTELAKQVREIKNELREIKRMLALNHSVKITPNNEAPSAEKQ
jgi:hypothetical protein